MKLGLTAIFTLLAVTTWSCGSSRPTDASSSVIGSTLKEPARSCILPKALVYKTDGNCNDLVPVTMDNDRNCIISFPAPTDITELQKPIKLIEGYLLDRRGITINTAFTHYTYTEYATLSSTPTIEELEKAILPDARVTQLVVLPMTLNQAINDTNRCNELIKSGFPGCEIITP